MKISSSSDSLLTRVIVFLFTMLKDERKDNILVEYSDVVHVNFIKASQWAPIVLAKSTNALQPLANKGC